MKKKKSSSSSSPSPSSSSVILLVVAVLGVLALSVVLEERPRMDDGDSAHPSSLSFVMALTLKTTTTTKTMNNNNNNPNKNKNKKISVLDDEIRSNDSGGYPKRRDVLLRSIGFLPLAAAATGGVVLSQPQSVTAAETIPVFVSSSSSSSTSNILAAAGRKCTDIESCREIGEQKVQQELEDNPVIRLPNGVRYKKLKAGIGPSVVNDNDVVDIIYSISRANGASMYSVGFGYNKAGAGDGFAPTTTDAGIESYRVRLGRNDLPAGVESALVGAKKGERRRIEVPPSVGFETSNWNPGPTTRRGKAQIADYQSQMKGRGTSQPPFFAPLIWEVEILNFRGT
eukprot:CAMPEP_0113458072 /NCGR_PEP_ID=MMETSP0014_2-20120614/9732_1 /TAXON_ID=2857 /ORGANISM="Nitzschia sp." /LENGTH=340 /DNA_ID=CAMNT_0000349581 /DNA_START=92 /DNA_END=1114 /DNA_ORIENTATION=+ /assembly_acc=CAM_ASM_000159